MSERVHAIFENHWPVADASLIAERLNAHLGLSNRMLEYETALRSMNASVREKSYQQLWRCELTRTHEDIDQDQFKSHQDAGYLMEFRGPFGGLCEYEFVTDVSWMCDWYSFARTPKLRYPLLEASLQISRLRSGDTHPAIVLLPDSSCDAVLDALRRPMAELLDQLQSKFGPPAETLESTIVEDEDSMYTIQGYYVVRGNDDVGRIR